MIPKNIDKLTLKRVNPFQGLIIDDAIWRDSHEYHRNHQRLHSLAIHGPGIIAGLEVIANQSPDLSIIINPGIGIDPEGIQIERKPSRMQREHFVISCELSQPVERGIERRMGHIPVRFGPEYPGQVFSGGLSSQRDQGLEQNHGFLLGVAFERERLPVPQKFEPAECIRLYRPWPGLRHRKRHVRNEHVQPDQLFGEIRLDVEFNGFRAKTRQRAPRKGKESESGSPARVDGTGKLPGEHVIVAVI